MPEITVVYGEKVKTTHAPQGTLLGDAILATGLPIEQPCAGRGTCGLCKVIVEGDAEPPDEVEREHLTQGELAINNRLACRARVGTDLRIVLAPIVVYSNKIFKSSNRYKRDRSPLGLAIDLGSTTVAAFLTSLNDGEVQVGAASLNQQTVYGADVISRLAAALDNPASAVRLHKLALASINQAVDSLKLSSRIRSRIERVIIVGNVAMHHLLTQMPLHSIATKPFQPFSAASVHDATPLMGGIFPPGAIVSLPPLVGGFVGSDALACLAFFNFDKPPGPIAAIDLGTNGEVLVTDGSRILTASTAAGPAFEGVNISCGTRAVDGAIVQAHFEDDGLCLTTIAGEPPIGLTGSGLISVVHELRQAKVIEPNGRIPASPPFYAGKLGTLHGARSIPITPDGQISVSQWDIRELQKAKGAIRAAIDILLKQLNVLPRDLHRMILTGSFGGQVDIEAAMAMGLLPPVNRDVVEAIPNGAGLGAAIFLSDKGFTRGESLAARAEQVDLDQDPEFYNHYIDAMKLTP